MGEPYRFDYRIRWAWVSLTVFAGDGEPDVEDGEEGVDDEHPGALGRAAVLQGQRHPERLKHTEKYPLNMNLHRKISVNINLYRQKYLSI